MYKIPYRGQTAAPYVKGFCFYTLYGNELVYLPESEMAKHFTKIPGQITRGSPFGEALYSLAATGPTKWIEIGTWNGLGSTQCILDGFAARSKHGAAPAPQLLSLETDPCLYNAAETNLASHPARDTVDFRQGKLMPYSLVAAAGFPTPEYLGKEEQASPHYFMHYEREKALYESTSPVLPPFLPEVAVLDGGEYSGYLDWLHLEKSELQYLCLDDINATKNRRVVSELGPEWTRVSSGNDRMGWAMYKRA